MDVPTMSPQAVQALQAAGRKVELIDVRTPMEYREVHAEGARNVPLDTLDAGQLQRDPEALLVVLCRSGSRGRKACENLLQARCENVVNVEGGTLAWEQAGLSVVRGPRAMSLERQVRIAAGSLVVLGVGLGLWNPLALALSAFVGAGLVFSGITDTCGMGLLLAKMPWNRAPACKAGA